MLWGHGCYYRKADRGRYPGPSRNPVPILRYCCPGCSRTCSRLPLCIAPRRWYDWAVQQQVLQFLLNGYALHCCSRCTFLDRRTVRRWRDWLNTCSETFMFFLRSRFPEWGRSVDQPSFWRLVLDVSTTEGATVELGAHITGYGRKLSENWLYQWVNA